MKKIQTFACALIVILMTTACWESGKGNEITVAVFSVNDFHGGFVRNDSKKIPGGAALWQTLDSLKRLYPYHLTVSAGDNFGGSYFYNATRGELLPVLFDGLGITLSAIGNHEFDDGQAALAAKWQGSPLRPKDWDLEYICANVRDSSGVVPAFAKPFVTRKIHLPGGKSVTIGLAGLIASSTPQQTSSSKLKGLSFDGKYTAVLDSITHLSGYEGLEKATVRLLLTHIGTVTDGDQPVWDDRDAEELKRLSGNMWHGILSSHTHQQVCGRINEEQIPVVQGKWHGEYISILKVSVDTLRMEVTGVVPELCPVNPDIALEGDARHFQHQIDSLLKHTVTAGGTPIGRRLTVAARDFIHNRDAKYRQTEVGTLVCRAYAEAFRKAAGLGAGTIVVGASHFGSIRAGFTAGPVSVLDVGETLPFSNALRVYEMTGKELLRLVDFGFHNDRYGWLQTSWLDISRNAEGDVIRLSYAGPEGSRTAIADDTPCYLVVDEFITKGGDGYAPELFPEGKEVKNCDLPHTTDAFINYLDTFKIIGE